MRLPSNARQDALRGIAWMILACCLWAVVEEIGSRVPPGHSPFQVVWLRYATHLAAMCLALAPFRGRALVRTGRPVLQAVRSLLMLAMPLCFVAGLSRMKIDALWSVFWISPLLAMAVGRLGLGERVGAFKWGAAAAGLAGALLILAPRSLPGSPLVVLFPLGMAASYSAYQLMTRKFRDESTEANLFYTAFYVWLALTAVLPVFWTPMTWEAARPMVAIGIVGLAALLALDRAFHLAPVSVVAPVGYTQILWGHIAMKGGTGRLGLTALAGTALILGSAALIMIREWNASDPHHGTDGAGR